MKGVDIFCSSPASTAICSSMDHRSAVRRGPMPVHRLGQDSLIKTRRPGIPCSSELENIIVPRQHYYHQKSRNSTSSNKYGEQRRKSSADVSDLNSPRSSRYLLSDTPHFDILNESDRAKALVPSRSMVVARNLSSSESPSLRKCSSTRSSSRDQVVELRVSIHCKGCEGKVRKHISRMEGVKSFSIDLVAKKVTVIGDVTPLDVLTSVSRVKNAQFWPSPSSSSSTTSSSSSYSSSSSSSTATTPKLRLRY